MADISDVENALLVAIEAVRVRMGAAFSIYRGWPQAAALDAALAAGQTHITCDYRVNMNRVTAVYTDEGEIITSAPAPTLTVSVTDTTATFAGTCSADQVAGVHVGTTAWGVRCSASDTPTTIAAALATASGGSASGPAVTLAGLLEAKTGRDVMAIQLLRRHEAGVLVSVWSPTPEDRDTVSSAIEPAIASLKRITMPDTTSAVVRSNSVYFVSDKSEQASLYRRDLLIKVEYTVTLPIVRTPVLWPGLTYSPGSLRFGALAP